MIMMIMMSMKSGRTERQTSGQLICCHQTASSSLLVSFLSQHQIWAQAPTQLHARPSRCQSFPPSLGTSVPRPPQSFPSCQSAPPQFFYAQSHWSRILSDRLPAHKREITNLTYKNHWKHYNTAKAFLSMCSLFILGSRIKIQYSKSLSTCMNAEHSQVA